MSLALSTALEKAGLFNSDSLNGLRSKADVQGRTLLDAILGSGRYSEEQIGEAVAAYARLPFVKLASTTIDSEITALVPEKVARGALAMPLRIEEESGSALATGRRQILVVALADPFDLSALQEVEFSTNCTVRPVVATRTEILDAIGRFYAPEHWLSEFLHNVEPDERFQVLSGNDDLDVTAMKGRGDKGAPAVKLVNFVIQQGIREAASDIHIEPTLNHLLVRARVQGILKELLHAPKWLHDPLVSRLKILAKLDITERRIPQDGRVKVAFESRDVDLRISTLPTHFGEKVVMRILGSGQAVPPMDMLGLDAHELEVLHRAADQPQGLVLVTGPTGSGKTTTLYSVLNEIRNTTVNIVTVEDPIEFQLGGINQVQVNIKAGLTFATALRSILRQDPDVVMVGEVRDLETAEIAFHAAMTGHLVLSTLHTNGTIATVARLLDLGVDPFLISSTVNLIVAQRLLRRVCEHCSQEYLPSPGLLARLQLHQASFPFVRGIGCDHCVRTGYSGRIGVYELLRITPKLKQAINSKSSEGELRKAALAAGTVMLVDAALAKVKRGITTVEEIVRVIQLQEDDSRRCPSCAQIVTPDFVICPYCAFPLKTLCKGCRQELNPEWRHCPLCATAVQTGTVPRPHPPSVLSVRNDANGLAEKHSNGLKAKPHSDRAPVIEPTAKPQPDKPRILVVDDDDTVRTILTRTIEAMPIAPEVVAVGTGLAAVGKAAEMHPDIVVLDVNLPDIDGFEVCKRLRSAIKTAFTPILMLTVNADEQSRTQGFLVGTDDYMAKPFSPVELQTRVTRLLRRTYGF